MSKSITQTFTSVSPLKSKIRFDARVDESGKVVADPADLQSSLYFSRTALLPVLPAGHVPTKIRVVVHILETAPEVAPAA